MELGLDPHQPFDEKGTMGRPVPPSGEIDPPLSEPGGRKNVRHGGYFDPLPASSLTQSTSENDGCAFLAARSRSPGLPGGISFVDGQIDACAAEDSGAFWWDGFDITSDRATYRQANVTKMRTCGATRCRVRASATMPACGRSEAAAPPAPARARRDASTSMPVFVMLPLDTVKLCADGEQQVPKLQRPKALEVAMKALRVAGVRGVMVDVWWGLVEARSRTYRWEAYAELFAMAERVGLTVQPVMSFHSCGNNVNDDYGVSLPKWVHEIGNDNPDIYFTDRKGHRNHECVSLGCDSVPVLEGRTPVEVYKDFIEAICCKFAPLLGSTIIEITVGLGPAGELRYPSYPEGDRRWEFPGIGEFYCYEKFLLATLEKAACDIGKPEWGKGGPHDVGQYNNMPWETSFFHLINGRFASEYGDFFLNFYSSLLVAHANRVLAAALKVVSRFDTPCQCSTFEGSDAMLYSFGDEKCVVDLGVKLAGVHWWYNSRSHAAELTIGYYNMREHEGYAAVMEVLKKHNAILNFTCVKMNDYEHPPEGQCSLEGLFCQVASIAHEKGVEIGGENALPRYDAAAWRRIEANAFHDLLGSPSVAACDQVGCANSTRLEK